MRGPLVLGVSFIIAILNILLALNAEASADSMGILDSINNSKSGDISSNIDNEFHDDDDTETISGTLPTRKTPNQMLFDLVKGRKLMSLSSFEDSLRSLITTPNFFYHLSNSGFNKALQQLRVKDHHHRHLLQPRPDLDSNEEVRVEEELAEFRTYSDILFNRTHRRNAFDMIKARSARAWNAFTAHGSPTSSSSSTIQTTSCSHKHPQRGSVNDYIKLLLTNIGVFSSNNGTEFRRYNLSEATIISLTRGQVGDYLYKNTRSPFSKLVGIVGLTAITVGSEWRLALSLPGYFSASDATFGVPSVMGTAIAELGLLREIEDGTMVFYRILKSMGSIPSSPIAIARGLDNTIEAKSLVRRFQSLELVMPLPFLFNSDLTAAGGVDGVDNRENNDDDLASLLSTATTAATESDSNSSSSSSSLMMPSLLSSSTNSPRRQQVITFDATDYQLFWESEFLPDSSVSLSGDQKLIQIVMQRKLVPFSNTSSLSEEDQTQTSFLDRIHGFKTCPSGIYTEVTEVGWNKAVQSVRMPSAPLPPPKSIKWSNCFRSMMKGCGKHYFNQFQSPSSPHPNRGT